ncbi:hypothetical protein L9F63_008136, partial [Diploptera punctata]
MRNLLGPIENISQNARISFSPDVTNSKKKSKIMKKKPCITLLDFQKKENISYPVSKVLPYKKLVLNSYQQQHHTARWQSWLANTPTWILQIGLESADSKLSHNGNSADKENHYCGNESMNSSYFTIEDEMVQVDSSGIIDSDDEKDNSVHNMDEESKKWTDWSIQLTDGKLFITGKTGDGVCQAKDISSCELKDSNTLRFNNGVVYELVGMPDHFTNLPYYVRNKFQCGFPSDWKEVKELWRKYVNEGSPFGFMWSPDRRESIPYGSTFTNSIESSSHRSLIPIKTVVYSDTAKNSPSMSEVCKRTHSRIVKKGRDQMASKVSVKAVKKINYNELSESSIKLSTTIQRSSINESKILSKNESQRMKNISRNM